MEDLTLIIQDDGKIIIQEAPYIEDGFYIEIDKDIITLYNIPQYGGKEGVVGVYKTLIEALNEIKRLG